MWVRSILKQNARMALSNSYWTAVGVVLTATVVSELISLLFNGRYQVFLQETLEWNNSIMMGEPYPMPDMSWIAPFGLLSIAVTIFIYYPLSIGAARFFVRNRFGNTQYTNVFSGFKNGYLSGSLTLLVTDIFIGLWSLLFIIPGIVKSLQYSMMAFILSDNPRVGNSRAREISRILTNGEKGAIFVLGLSFIGWYLLLGFISSICAMFSPVLSMAAAFAGGLFLSPYIRATYAELYVFLRDRAIQMGQIHPAELCLTPAPPQNYAE